VDRRTIIEISRAKTGGVHAPCKLSVKSDHAGGVFVGENNGVHFLDIEEFKTALDTFLQARTGSATLRATDDCELEFIRWNAKGDVGMRYVIGTQFMEGDAAELSRIAVSGRFELHGEFVEQTAAQLLRELNV
jgi:hypothetical protein